jgi:putative ABC transport system permease protein
MDFVAILKIALRALARNKLRSGLTMLGIIIGVGAVIAMVGVGQGANSQVQAQIANMGTNLLVVLAGSANMGGVRTGSSAVKTLIVDDMTAILRECTAVKEAAPGVQTRAQVIYQNQNWAPSGGITGTSPEYFDVRTWPIKEGVSFDKSEVDRAGNVAVLGTTVVDTMFGGEDPIGKTIRIKNLPFKVIGVTTSKGQSSFGQDQDDIVFVPYTTVQKKLAGITWLQTIHVQAISQEATGLAQQQIETLLRERHRLRQDEDNDFMVRNLADVAQLAEESGRVMTLLLGSIASVSLIVGGIGIMNIMLVSVTERTREIGIRMAIGATESDVQRQFLIEAVVLSLMGGILGIIMGVTTSGIISKVLRWPTQISPVAIVVAVFFSIGVGIFFGFYPARKAARLDPIEALRYE